MTVGLCFSPVSLLQQAALNASTYEIIAYQKLQPVESMQSYASFSHKRFFSLSNQLRRRRHLNGNAFRVAQLHFDKSSCKVRQLSHN